ncbi:MAG TPA: GNAT family N-acetyltransferase, partial [Xanthomonadaceae bacterium]|nr:GNAT family N-acetyltransferase [Xanthomonadaceae bacterium]
MEHADSPAWYAYLRLPHVLEHTSWSVASAEHLRPLVDDYNSDLPSSSSCFAIESVARSELVGAIGFHTVSPVNRSAEIAFNLHPDHWSRGVATRCCAAVS